MGEEGGWVNGTDDTTVAYYSFSLSYCDLAGICFVCVVLQTEGM